MWSIISIVSRKDEKTEKIGNIVVYWKMDEVWNTSLKNLVAIINKHAYKYTSYASNTIKKLNAADKNCLW